MRSELTGKASTRPTKPFDFATASKEEFIALLSHELRSPLSPSVNALQILR
jgi:signal transduction histidine kinase